MRRPILIWIGLRRSHIKISVVILLLSFMYLISVQKLHLMQQLADEINRKTPPVLILIALAIVLIQKYTHDQRFMRLFTSSNSDWHKGFGALLCICITLNSILLTWINSHWGYSKIGGVLPWSDARNYFEGAYLLANAEQLDAFNSRRPINAALFSLRLFLTNGNFYHSMLFQGILFSLSIFFFLKELSRHVYFPGLLIAGVIILQYAKPYLDLTLSETLGLTLSFAGTTALLNFIRSANTSAFFLSVVLISLAMSARSGPYFILLALVLYSPMLQAKSLGKRVGSLVITLFCSLIGTFNSMFLNALYGQGNSQNGNFSFTLYGIAKGGLGWLAYQADFSNQVFTSEAALSRAVLHEAFLSIITNPLLFLRGLWVGLESYLDSGFYGFSPGLPNFIFFGLFVLGFVSISKRDSNTALRSISFLWLTGLLLSIPFIFQDGGYRVTATALPFLAVLPAVGISALSKQGTVKIFNMEATFINKEVKCNLIRQFIKKNYLTLLFVPGLVLIALLPKVVDVGIKIEKSEHSQMCAPDEIKINAEMGTHQPVILHSKEVSEITSYGNQSTEWYRSQVRAYGIEIEEALSRVPEDTYILETSNHSLAEFNSLLLLVHKEDMPIQSTQLPLCAKAVEDPLGAKYGLFNARVAREGRD